MERTWGGEGGAVEVASPKNDFKERGAFPPRLKGRRRRLEDGKERGARLAAPRDSH